MTIQGPFLKRGRIPKTTCLPKYYNKFTFDVETMKRTWAEVVGFKSPDLTGKIAPEIKPGTYNYKDKDKFPFKELMIPYHYEKFAPAQLPFPGRFQEIKVVPTRQYYLNLDMAKATLANMGRTKQDDKGYLIPSSYMPGIPFPRPSGAGQFKAIQVVYNMQLLQFGVGSTQCLYTLHGFNRRMEKDWDATNDQWALSCAGRIYQPKVGTQGFYDERAQKRGEIMNFILHWLSPQDSVGNAMNGIGSLDPLEPSQTFMYIGQMRRVRKLSAEDTQDSFQGADFIGDDGGGNFSQKLSPDVFHINLKLQSGNILFQWVGRREHSIWTRQIRKCIMLNLSADLYMLLLRLNSIQTMFIPSVSSTLIKKCSNRYIRNAMTRRDVCTEPL